MYLTRTTLYNLHSLLLVFAVSLTAFAQEAELNKPAPPIIVDRWIDNPHYPQTPLEGKAIVLKFWFTQCGPCVYSIPHMNDLAETFKAEEVAFVSVSFEKPAVIRPFLGEKEFRAMAGSDTARTTINAYGVHGYPVVFLIDKEGLLRWKGYPMSLNESMISYLLDIPANRAGTGQIKIDTGRINELGFENPSFSLEIGKNTTGMGEASGRYSTAKELTIANYSLKETLSYLLEQSELRIKVPDSADTKYDIRFQVEQGLDSLSNLKKRLASVIAQRLGYRLATVTQRETAYRLEIADDSLFAANFVDCKSTHSGTSSSKDTLRGFGLTKNQALNMLEDSFMHYFSDGIGLTEKYTMNIPTGDFNALKERLRNVYGIKLKEENADVEVFTLIPEQFE